MDSDHWQKRVFAAQAGMVLLEAVFAAALIAIALAGISHMNWKSLALLKTNKQESSACFCLQERAERVRNMAWSNLTSANYLAANLMNSDAGGAANVPGEIETITINSYPTASAIATQITRPYGGPASIGSVNNTLATSSMVRIDFQISWPGYAGSSHVRQFSTVIANGGIKQ